MVRALVSMCAPYRSAHRSRRCSFGAFQDEPLGLRAFALEQLRLTALAMANESTTLISSSSSSSALSSASTATTTLSLTASDDEQLHNDYESLLELCIFHVLVPQGDVAAAKQLLVADAILSAEKKSVRAVCGVSLFPILAERNVVKQLFATLIDDLCAESIDGNRSLQPVALRFDEETIAARERTVTEAAAAAATTTVRAVAAPSRAATSSAAATSRSGGANDASLFRRTLNALADRRTRRRVGVALAALATLGALLVWLRRRQRRRGGINLLTPLIELLSMAFTNR